MFLLQTTPTASTDFVIGVLNTIFANADKIGIALICAFVLVVIVLMFRYLENKEKRNSDLNEQIFKLAADNNEAGRAMTDTSNSIKEGALALAESSRLLVDVVSQGNAALRQAITEGFTGLVPSIRQVFHEELQAAIDRQSEKSGIVVETLSSQMRELKEFFSEFSSRRTGMFILDAERNILFASEEVLDIFEIDRNTIFEGQTPTKLLSHFSLIFPDGSAVRDDQMPSAHVQRTKQASMPVVVGFKSRTINRWVWVQMNGIPFFNDAGELVRITIHVSELGTIIMDRTPVG